MEWATILVRSETRKKIKLNASSQIWLSLNHMSTKCSRQAKGCFPVRTAHRAAHRATSSQSPLALVHVLTLDLEFLITLNTLVMLTIHCSRSLVRSLDLVEWTITSQLLEHHMERVGIHRRVRHRSSSHYTAILRVIGRYSMSPISSPVISSDRLVLKSIFHRLPSYGNTGMFRSTGKDTQFVRHSHPYGSQQPLTLLFQSPET